MTPSDDDLIAGVAPAHWERNGVPDPGLRVRREEAASAAGEALQDVLHPDGLRMSPLGAGWSSDIDAYVRSWPDGQGLQALGWLPLDGPLARLGATATGRWAVVTGGRVTGALDLHEGPPPDPVATVLGRCRRRGAVRLREVLELRALHRAGHPLPAHDDIVAAAADTEAALGGNVLAAWATGRARPCPAPVPRRRSGLGERVARRVRRRRLVLALSGVDGSGKSTLTRHLVDDLRAANVPVTAVWMRPGMGLDALRPLRRALKRLLGIDPRPGVDIVAAGHGPVPASRRGVVGWIWSLVVTLVYVAATRRQHHRARGVVVYDRHLLDALVTLDLVYGGVGRGIHRAVVRRALPSATLSFHLDAPAELALRRKQDPLFGAHAVIQQIALYEQQLAGAPDVHRLDAHRPPAELSLAVLHALIAEAGGTGPT